MHFSPKNIFLKNVFWFAAYSKLHSLHFSVYFHMKPCSQVSCLCYVDADKEKIESATWHACVLAFFACFTYLASSPARRTSVLYMVACLAYFTCSRAWLFRVLYWRAYVLDVFHKNGVLGVLHKVTCVKLLNYFLCVCLCVCVCVCMCVTTGHFRTVTSECQVMYLMEGRKLQYNLYFCSKFKIACLNLNFDTYL